jgi:hypothetical protein
MIYPGSSSEKRDIKTAWGSQVLKFVEVVRFLEGALCRRGLTKVSLVKKKKSKGSNTRQ